MITKQHRQEALSRAYVQAVAACCGMTCEVRTTDYGIDLTLHDIVQRGDRRSESGYVIDVQAKSTTRASLEETVIKYDLEVKAYDDLRDPEAKCPRILVLLVLPQEESEWLHLTEEELRLRHCAYWMSLCGWEPVTNQKTVRIAILRANVFSVEALRDLMNRAKQGVSL